MHDLTAESPSAWVTRFATLIRPGGTVLDLACGRGRNARWLAEQRFRVTAVDREAAMLAELQGVDNIQTLQADLETGAWPFEKQRFDSIVVCRYLHRPLLPLLARSMEEDGILIYETFMAGQEQFGKPSNPDFLLKNNELFNIFNPLLEILSFEQGLVHQPNPAMLQRICARRPVMGCVVR